MFDTRSEVRGQVLRRFGNLLGALGGGLARAVIMRTLNHEGDKPRLLRPFKKGSAWIANRITHEISRVFPK
ncbi:hypothetical protein [Tardiphaga sp. 709]|uniref:hypothetical protein n=1 Tax=Tardiphaga sp. 709 TaxID=3076039 RepID=UPI0028E4E17F|nr:hypothetical protein [Tardiphaga sp. 709]WNV07807.1 hypothetical protein RSO67_20100 [Tardiphaga sp. 709]